MNFGKFDKIDQSSLLYGKDLDTNYEIQNSI